MGKTKEFRFTFPFSLDRYQNVLLLVLMRCDKLDENFWAVSHFMGNCWAHFKLKLISSSFTSTHLDCFLLSIVVNEYYDNKQFLAHFLPNSTLFTDHKKRVLVTSRNVGTVWVKFVQRCVSKMIRKIFKLICRPHISLIWSFALLFFSIIHNNSRFGTKRLF